MSMAILELASYGEAAPHWEELERTYRSGELTFDLEAHRIIWSGFYVARGATLRVLAATEGGRTVGIFPLLHTVEDAEGSWTFTDDFVIGREYFCPPDRIHEILPHLPPHLADDLSCFYRPAVLTDFAEHPGAVVDLGQDFGSYLASLPRKSRYELRRCWESNRDLEIEEDRVVRRAEIAHLHERYLEYWRARAAGSVERLAYSRDKVATDLDLMERASQLGKLVALYISLGGNLVAANFAVLRDRDRVDDYLCLRDTRPDLVSRGVGIFAVLANMEACRRRGVRHYDLSACITDYKRKFLNTGASFYAWNAGPPYRPAEPAAAAPARASESVSASRGAG